ncbi:hypothetical protein SDC9_194447 [bioreactor metagenome]|uniref:Uncharacterized protein n=1 Tax=bioreactor metagenome TaxID=1076179 RepID=A0A645I6H6_9ZZZZ
MLVLFFPSDPALGNRGKVRMGCVDQYSLMGDTPFLVNLIFYTLNEGIVETTYIHSHDDRHFLPFFEREGACCHISFRIVFVCIERIVIAESI